MSSTKSLFLFVVLVFVVLIDGCQKKPEIVRDPNAECDPMQIERKDKILNGTYGPDEYCNQCYCVDGKWKCEIKKCGCYPGAPIHIWMNNVRIGCFCTMEGILNKSDCTSEWFSIRKGRSLPERIAGGRRGRWRAIRKVRWDEEKENWERI